ncbi:MAG: signal peptidase I [Cyanobium sp.]|jgi:signal peptidase I|nr:signal peptidase I [Synechococcaceae cyanobacterium]
MVPGPPAVATETTATGKGSWRRQLLGLVIWVVLALLLRWWVIEPRWIPSGSMLPTLQLQDRILVEKVRPQLGLPLQPGTIVVFRPPAALIESGYDPEAALIKRLVGLPGDRIEVREGRLWRNGVPLQPDWSPVRIDYQMPPLTVPAKHLLVFGDNRNTSLDSHIWGPLPQTALIGTAVWRYWPLNRFGPIRFSPVPLTQKA